MCFYTEFEWYASVNKEGTETLDHADTCMECWAEIPANVPSHFIYQQEHEDCGACYEGECDCPGSRDEDECICDHECKCESPNLGETYTYRCCIDCHHFRQAIIEAEKEAGCPADQQEPYLAGMIEAISEQDSEEALKYFEKAAALYPNMKSSGYLSRLWKRAFKTELVLP